MRGGEKQAATVISDGSSFLRAGAAAAGRVRMARAHPRAGRGSPRPRVELGHCTKGPERRPNPDGPPAPLVKIILKLHIYGYRHKM